MLLHCSFVEKWITYDYGGFSSRGGGISTYFLTGTCHFARKIGTHNSVNSGGF